MTRKQPKVPKPVEAWAVWMFGDIMFTSIGPKPIDANGWNSHHDHRGTVWPVRIVPIVKRTKRKERKK